MLNKNFKNKYDNCDHKWKPFFHEVIDKTETKMRVSACISCSECGMFRTKILEFRYPTETGLVVE